jgi:hypothetical protein
MLVEKPEEESPLERPSGMEDEIKMGSQKRVWGRMYWINLAQNRDS